MQAEREPWHPSDAEPWACSEAGLMCKTAVGGLPVHVVDPGDAQLVCESGMHLLSSCSFDCQF
jgi:hypothetical protein